jgi:TPR repeat protein
MYNNLPNIPKTMTEIREYIDSANTAYNFSRWKEAYTLYSYLEKQMTFIGHYSGCGHILYRLGFMYNRGHYVKKTPLIAKNYFIRSLTILEKDAEQNDPEALCDLAFMYNVGDGLPVDKGKAFYYYQRAAETGYYRGLYNLGFMYSNGQGVKQDKAKAAHYYQLAATQGHTWAQNNLGLLYDQGEGVQKDKKMAVFWYRRAAEQKHASAQNNLGLMYEKGDGVDKDLKLAFHYYQSAMDNGNLGAQYNLARFYEKGVESVKQNLSLAVKYFLEAAMKGQNEALNHTQDILEGRVPHSTKNKQIQENYQLLGIIQLSKLWPESHVFLSTSCKLAIRELSFTLPIVYTLLPELVEIIIRELILNWPEKKYYFTSKEV